MTMTDTAERQTTPNGTTQPQSEGRALTPVNDIKAGLERMRPQFKVALPSHISPERFERTVLTAMNNNPDLLTADRRSLFNACSKAAQDGLLPDGREGALVIFKDKSGKKLCQWLPMTYGIIKLMRQSGEIDSVGSRIVFQKEIDEKRFEYFISEGREQLRHEPMLWGDRGEKVLVYAYVRWKSGHVEYLPMHRDDILKRKKVSRAKSEFSPWNVWEDEMWLKTPIKALGKRMPLSASIMRALDRDEAPTEFDKLKGEALQNISEAASQMGAPQIEHHDAETGEIIDGDEEDADDSAHTTLLTQAELSAKGGTREFDAFWQDIDASERKALLGDEDRLRALAAEADKAAT